MESEVDHQPAEPDGSHEDPAENDTEAAASESIGTIAEDASQNIGAIGDSPADQNLIENCKSEIRAAYEKHDYTAVISASLQVDTSYLDATDCCKLATAYVKTGELEKSRKLITTFDWKNSTDCKLTALGKLLLSQGRKQDARAHFEEALRTNPRNTDALDELLSLWPEDEAAVRAKGEALRLRGEAQEAAATLKTLIENGANGTDLYRSAGIAMADTKNYEEAERLLKEAAAGDNDAEATIALGLVQLEKNATAEGIRNIEKGLGNGASRRPEVIKRLTLAYVETGENEKASEAVEYLSRGTLDERQMLELNETILDLSARTGNHGMTLLAADKLLQHDHVDTKYVGAKIDALSALRRFEEAVVFLESHRDMDGYDEKKMLLQRRAGKLSDAEPIADRILRADRGNQEALFTKLYIAFRRGEGKAALERFGRQALKHGDEKVLRLFLEMAKNCGNDTLVVKACQSLIGQGAGTMDVLIDRATAVERLGRLNQSKRYLRKMHKTLGNRASLELLTAFYARHGRQEDEEGVLTEAYSKMQLPVALLERLAKLKMERGNAEEALSVIATAMERKETPEGRYLQAEVLLKAGRAEEARETVLRAMQLGYPGKIGEYLAGRAEEALGDAEAALERYNRAIGYGLSSPDVFLSRVRLLKNMGRTGEAKEEMQSAEKMFADNSLVRSEAVEFYYSTGMHQRCIETAEGIIKGDRTNSRAWSRRGLSLIVLKRYDEAIVSLEASLKLSRDAETIMGLKEAYLAKGDKKSTIRAIDMLLEFKGTEKSLLLEKGDVLAETGMQEEALNTYQAAVERYGQDDEAVLRKARILHDKNQYQDELETLLEMLKAEDKKPAVLSRIAEAYLGLKRYSDALEYADRAMQMEPDNSRHLDTRAEILCSLGRQEEAERSVDIALSISPKDPVALEIKGNILISDGRYAQALEVLNGTLAAGICNPRIYKNRGDALLKLERYSEALDSYSKSLKDAPHSPGALLGKGICELNLEKYSSATLSLNELTKKDPGNASGWYYFGVALKYQRIHSEAKRAFSEAVRLDGTQDRAWYELGTILLETGELDEAENAFIKSLEYAPQSRDAQEELESCRGLKRKLRAEDNAVALLKLEYEMNRNPTKEEAFSVCKIPMDDIDLAFDLIREPTALPVPSSGDKGWRDVEERSAAVLAKCFRNKETASYGVRLCDIVANFPSFTLDEAKQIFEYIVRVQKLSVIDAIEDDKFEKLMKKATKLGREERSLIGIITNLGVGIYTAKLIEGSLASMGVSGYTTDFVNFSGEHRDEVEKQEGAYDPYAVRKELYEQFYGQPPQQAEQEEGTGERCLYHGQEAIGACSSCQTNICNNCLAATEGHCPNCGVVLLNDESSGAPSY